MLTLQQMITNTIQYLLDELRIARNDSPEEVFDEISDEIIAEMRKLESLYDLMRFLMLLPDNYGVIYWSFDNDSEAWEFIAYAQLDVTKEQADG